jgi:hypothetical protein
MIASEHHDEDWAGKIFTQRMDFAIYAREFKVGSG